MLELNTAVGMKDLVVLCLKSNVGPTVHLIQHGHVQNSATSWTAQKVLKTALKARTFWKKPANLCLVTQQRLELRKLWTWHIQSIRVCENVICLLWDMERERHGDQPTSARAPCWSERCHEGRIDAEPPSLSKASFPWSWETLLYLWWGCWSNRSIWVLQETLDQK